MMSMQATTVTPDRILELGYAFRGAKALLCAVELDVFTTLAQAPLDLDSLAQKCGIAQRGARDFFDALVALGMLDRSPEGRYGNTQETDRYLDARKPTYIGRDLAHLSERMYPLWNLLTAALRTGMPQSGASTGDYFARLYDDQATLGTFVKGMTGGTVLAAKTIAEKFPWDRYETLVDVGTAEGCFPVEIAQAHPHVRGGGFDLPQVRAMFEQYVDQRNLSHRLSFYPGDFLIEPLPAADVLVMGRVLHNWDLARKRLLLAKAYDALPRGGALIVYERLIDNQRCANYFGLLASLHMLIVTTGGFDFTADDCIGWMGDAGFREARVDALGLGLSMITALK